VKLIKLHPLYFLIVIIPIFSACNIAQSQIENQLAQTSKSSPEWQEDFELGKCILKSTGSSEFFILEPGFQLVLEGGGERLAITVLDETININGVETRVVEEREWRNDEIIEISYNFFAICEQTGDVFYFGEDVDMFTDGQLSSHSGAWRAGVENARAGLIMPGQPVVGMKYYQEIAPGVAMDRAEVISLEEKISTPAGDFEQVLKTREGTALNPMEKEFKQYAPGIGLVQDQNLLLTSSGYLR